MQYSNIHIACLYGRMKLLSYSGWTRQFILLCFVKLKQKKNKKKKRNMLDIHVHVDCSWIFMCTLISFHFSLYFSSLTSLFKWHRLGGEKSVRIVTCCGWMLIFLFKSEIDLLIAVDHKSTPWLELQIKAIAQTNYSIHFNLNFNHF